MAFPLRCLLLVAGLIASSSGLGLFFRTSWVHEVPRETLSAWFDLIAKGRAEGPSSPYYVEFLALQNIACNQMYPIGPPCNASAPTTSKQALGNSSLPYASVWEEDLAVLSKYFYLFDTVYIGTMWVDDWNPSDPDSNTKAAALQAQVASRFLELYPNVPNMAWYVTIEGSLNDIGATAQSSTDMADFLQKTASALTTLRRLPILWSPAVTRPYSQYSPSEITSLRAHLVTLFQSITIPIHLHFQDFLGQSVTFTFPFFYNYSQAFTCEADTVPYVALLKTVQASVSTLAEVKAYNYQDMNGVNMEMFAERLQDGLHGENNGANIINANPNEIAQRMACYSAHGLSIGACWALPHWFYLWSYANTTVFQPY